MQNNTRYLSTRSTSASSLAQVGANENAPRLTSSTLLAANKAQRVAVAPGAAVPAKRTAFGEVKTAIPGHNVPLATTNQAKKPNPAAQVQLAHSSHTNNTKKPATSGSLLASSINAKPLAQTIAPVVAAARPKSQPAFKPNEVITDFDDDRMVCDEEFPAAFGGAPVAKPKAWVDIDEADAENVLCVAEIVNDIYDNLMKRQSAPSYRLSPQYMSHQQDINEKMRAILVDWLLDVHSQFRLLPETLYLSVFIVDRFLSLKSISRDKLQLVGITSMFIASKYEEIYPPECNDFVYIAANAYTREDILLMEQNILNTLGFLLSAPTSLYFLRRYSKAAVSDYKVHTLSKFLAEAALCELKLLAYLPSQIAAASIFLARAMTAHSPIWTPTLEHYTKIGMEELKPIVNDLNESVKRMKDGSLQAVFRKYTSRKLGEVAKIPLLDAIN